MRCIPRLFAFLCLALVCAAPAYATTYFFETVRVDASGNILGPGMDGPSEQPANASPGTGYGTAVYDDAAHTLAVDVSFSGLAGNTTASHIHAPTAIAFTQTQMAGVATTTPTFAGFPLGVTSGAYSNTLNLTLSSSYNPAYVTANGGSVAASEVALFNAMLAGKSYWNIHSSFVTSGEIRGFLRYVPEPASAGLAMLGVAAFGCVARRRR